MKIIGNKNCYICINNNILSINDKNYQLPKDINSSRISIINGIVSIKGYTLKNDKFVKNNLDSKFYCFIKKIKEYYKKN